MVSTYTINPRRVLEPSFRHEDVGMFIFAHWLEVKDHAILATLDILQPKLAQP